MRTFNWIFVTCLFLLTIGSCRKETEKFEKAASSATPVDPAIIQAHSFYDRSQLSNRSSANADTVEIFYAVELNWAQARVAEKDSQATFVMVPVVVDAGSNMLGDLIFYSGNCGYSMELWWFPPGCTFTNNQHELLQNGKVCVMNQCYQHAQVFVVENGKMVFADSISIPGGSELEAQDRGPEVKCPTWGTSIWEHIGDFFESLGTAIASLFGGGSGGNWSNWSPTVGGFSINFWSGMGAWWNLPSGGSGGTNNGNNGNSTGTNQAYDPPVHPALQPPNGNNVNMNCMNAQILYFMQKYQIDILSDDYADFAYTCFGDACDFAQNEPCMIDALNAAAMPDEDGIINILDPENGPYTGPREHIPPCIRLSNGKQVTVEFGTTKDDKNADQPIAVCLIAALIDALECVSEAGYEINSIYINATTNGAHTSPKTNHSAGLAIDLSRINGIKMIQMNSQQLQAVAALQNCLEEFSGMRENFGPMLKHKSGLPYNVANHNDHVHFSIDRNTSCNNTILSDHKCN